jgi:DNA-binding MurR/RpiR family transcriptional regulator
MKSENLLSRIQKLGKLTPSEAKIADFFRRDYPRVAMDTVTAISKKTKTSKATVARFISKLGYEGFTQFQDQQKCPETSALFSQCECLDRGLQLAP